MSRKITPSEFIVEEVFSAANAFKIQCERKSRTLASDKRDVTELHAEFVQLLILRWQVGVQ